MQASESDREVVRGLLREEEIQAHLNLTIRGILRKLTRFQKASLGEDSVADIYNATAHRALMWAAGYKPELGPHHWLKAIAQNIVSTELIKYRRRAAGQRNYARDLVPGEFAADRRQACKGSVNSLVKTEVFARLDRLDIEEILRSLPRKQGEALRRRYIDGMSTKEVAKVLQLNENATRQLIHRGRMSFRDLW